jgi:hypothetical protein
MNAAAAALGPAYNVFPDSSNKLVPAPPAFLRYRPGPFLRPCNLSRTLGRPGFPRRYVK